MIPDESVKDSETVQIKTTVMALQQGFNFTACEHTKKKYHYYILNSVNR